MKTMRCPGIELEKDQGDFRLIAFGHEFTMPAVDLGLLRDALCDLPLPNAKTRVGYEALARQQSREILLTPDGKRNALIAYLRLPVRELTAAEVRQVLKAFVVEPAQEPFHSKSPVMQALLNSARPMALQRGVPVGLVLTYRDKDGKVRLGWSLYHRNREKHPPSRYIGIVRAAKTSLDLGQLLANFIHHKPQDVVERKLLMGKSYYLNVPQPLRPLWLHMAEQGAKYFGLVPKQIPEEAKP